MGLRKGLYGLVNRHGDEYRVGAVIALGNERELDAQLRDILGNHDLEFLGQSAVGLESHFLDSAADRSGILVVLAVVQVDAEPSGQGLVHAAGQRSLDGVTVTRI